jgi:multisubunit Na+/H+ antiporter MnhE subunit
MKLTKREIGFIVAIALGLIIGKFLKSIKLGVVAALLLVLIFSMIASNRLNKK